MKDLIFFSLIITRHWNKNIIKKYSSLFFFLFERHQKVLYLFSFISMIDVRATRNQFNSFNWIKTILTILTKGSYNMSKTRHGSSDGRTGDSESKGPGFNPRMDPMRLCFKICVVFLLYHFCIKKLAQT